MRQWLRAGVLVVLAPLAGCSRESVPSVPPVAPPATVRVERAALQPLTEALEAVGSVRTKTQILVASKIQGYVREVRYRQGEHVEPGDVLVTIDDREPTARVDRARAALAESHMALDEAQRGLEEAAASLRSAEADRVFAEATAERNRRLFEKELISSQDYEGVEAKRKSTTAAVEQAEAHVRVARSREVQMRHRIAQAQADLRTAELTLGDTRIAAPATGVVVDRRAEPGDLAVPGQPLLVLDDPRAYRLEAEVAESAVGRVRVGQRVPVVLDSLQRTLEGRVAEIIPAADTTSRTVTVKLDLPVEPGLRTGLFGRARFAVGERRALLVPVVALVERGQLTGVYVVDAQGVARLRLITIGMRQADRAEVLSGLEAGEAIVVDGVAGLSDGARVAAAP